jgi:hypothetical protein
MPGTKRPIHLEHFIQRFQSVLVVGTGNIDNTTVPRLHKSFVEFITNDCDDRFRVNTITSSEALAIQCLGRLNALSRDMCKIEHFAKLNVDILDLSSRIETYLSPHLRYACRFWTIHLSRAKATEVVTVQQLFRDFFYQHLLHWIEVMSLLEYNSVFSLLDRAAEWAHVMSFLFLFFNNG